MLPAKIAYRKKNYGGKPLEAKLLQSTPKKNYIVAQTINQSAKYKENIEQLAKFVNTGEITTFSAARHWIKSMRDTC